MKKTITFGILGDTLQSNLTRNLPDRFEVDEYLFIKVGAHNIPKYVGSQNDSPNIVLHFGAEENRSEPLQLPQPAVFGVRVPITRFSKATYNYMLNRFFAGTEGYEPVVVYCDAAQVPQRPGERYVFRGKFGARGRSMGVTPPGKTPVWVETKIREATAGAGFDSLTAAGLKINVDNRVVGAEQQQRTILDDLSLIEWTKLQDVDREYRLVTDHEGDFAICVRRKLVERENGMMMAIGADAEQGDVIDLTDPSFIAMGAPFGDERLAEIITHLKTIKFMPLHSFDLFITKTNTWGFFEASCEFGECALPSGWAYRQAKLYMRDLAKNHLHFGN